MPAIDKRAASVEGAQRDRHELAGGGEEDRRRRAARAARRRRRRPRRRRARARSSLRLGRAGQDVDGGALVERHLGREVRRGAEPVDAETAARRQRGAPQRPVADDAGAQQRGGLHVGEPVRDRVGEGLGDDGLLGVAAVASQPVKRGATHRFSSPRRQNRHSPQVWRSQAMPMRSPSWNRVRARTERHRPRRRPRGRAPHPGAEAPGRLRRGGGRCGTRHRPAR